MSGAKPLSEPPVLPGYEFSKPLGKGGFADVFLYRREHPRQNVAVKVMRPDRLDHDSVRRFMDEANLMAELVAHPSIVSIYDSAVSADGRPYLIMEYCPDPNLQVQHSARLFSEAETLRTGIRIAGAVETAHRAGILHRDLKPANILGGAFGQPKLSDFGIAGSSTSAAAGLSVPWSPPEAFGGTPSAASDVYSLAATLYTLLTNRSPFQIPGGDNSDMAMMTRIATLPVPRTGRADVSEALEQVLSRAMSKNPRDRYVTAAEFGRSLQHVQIGLRLTQTEMDLEEEHGAPRNEPEEGPKTRFRSVVRIDAQAPVVQMPIAGPLLADTQVGFTPVVADTVSADRPSVVDSSPIPGFVPAVQTGVGPSPDVSPPSSRPASTPTRKRRWIAGAAVGAIIAIAALVVIAVAVVPRDTRADPAPSLVDEPIDAAPASTTPMVTDLSGTVADGVASFSWTNPAPESGDVYLWRLVVPGETHDFAHTTDTHAVVPLSGSAPPCIEVVVRRADGRSSVEGTEGCAK